MKRLHCSVGIPSALQRLAVTALLLVSPSLMTAAANVSPELGSTGEVLQTILYERSGATAALIAHPNPAQLLGMLLLISMPLFALYGACMGLAGGLRQSVASAAKTPLLFLCTLLVCGPVLVILSILTGLKLDVLQIASLVLMCLAFNALLLACFGPLSAFFGLSSDYHFMKLLHVGVFAICGLISTSVLYSSLQIAISQQGLPTGTGALLFLFWIATYGFVGLQMAWTLRPLIGEPGLPFQWLRRRESGMSVYTAIGLSMRSVGEPADTPHAPAAATTVAKAT